MNSRTSFHRVGLVHLIFARVGWEAFDSVHPSRSAVSFASSSFPLVSVATFNAIFELRLVERDCWHDVLVSPATFDKSKINGLGVFDRLTHCTFLQRPSIEPLRLQQVSVLPQCGKPQSRLLLELHGPRTLQSVLFVSVAAIASGVIPSGVLVQWTSHCQIPCFWTERFPFAVPASGLGRGARMSNLLDLLH